MKNMTFIDKKIESLFRGSFIDLDFESSLNALKEQLTIYHQAGYQYKMVETLIGDVNDLIQMVELPEQMNPEQASFLPFIEAEKLAALRLLDFNAAAGLAGIEKILDSSNQKTTRLPIKIPAISLKMYYFVFIKGKDIYIQIDTNYKQYKWELQKFFKSLKTQNK